ncbi:hypothetical protein GWK16_21350 [Roseomonas sp. JC162]|uniref:DUF1311 domain-containing protein n=1 Tax=Neoroseomonas marina TaxID=1232220 RepID=A0A848EKA3_9PROT|nr:hypothetical protein [Neoroseomonas marina]NMJ43808.1 hypothetical protein [Neoroseomonas marina]
MTKIPLAVLGLAALLAVPAKAAGVDCTRPADDWQRTICADPTLTALEAEVAATFAGMQGIPWRRGLRERHETAIAVLRRDAAQDPEAIRRGLQARLAALREENAWFSTHGLEEAPERRLRTTCLALPTLEDAAAQRRPCRVAEFRILGTVDGRRFAHALYEYTPDPTGELPHETAILVFSAGQPGEWTVEIAERLTHASCMRPVIARHGEETLLFLPCEETGTAGSQIPQLYRRAGPPSFRRWEDMDPRAWQSGLERHLPPAMDVFSEPRFDPERLTAAFRLIRHTDPPCCPTGGIAEARLALEGGRLVLRGVVIRPAR